MSDLTCPRCRVAVRPRASRSAIEHCPRCLVRDDVAVPMTFGDGPAGQEDVRLHGLSWRTGEDGTVQRR